MTSELGTNKKKGNGITFRFKEAGSGTQAGFQPAHCCYIIRATPQDHSENHWE